MVEIRIKLIPLPPAPHPVIRYKSRYPMVGNRQNSYLLQCSVAHPYVKPKECILPIFPTLHIPFLNSSLLQQTLLHMKEALLSGLARVSCITLKLYFSLRRWTHSLSSSVYILLISFVGIDLFMSLAFLMLKPPPSLGWQMLSYLIRYNLFLSPSSPQVHIHTVCPTL